MKDQLSDPAFGNMLILLGVLLACMFAPAVTAWVARYRYRRWKRNFQKAIDEADELLKSLR